MLAEQEAVVAGEQEYRVVELAHAPQRFIDRPTLSSTDRMVSWYVRMNVS